VTADVEVARAAERYILQKISEVLEEIDVPQQGDVVELITRAKQIFVYGAGRSSLVARSFAMRLVQLGLKVFFVGDSTTPIVEKGDLVFIVSRTGETMSAIQTANICRRVGATVVTITAQKPSKLSHASSIVLHLKVEKDKGAAVLAPLGTVFEDAAMIFLDGLVAQLMKVTGQTEADMRARHAIMV
jgi:6-phospho-3-hexuloisomerase